MPCPVDIVVGGIVELPRRQDGAQLRLAFFRRAEIGHLGEDRLLHGLDPQVLLQFPAEGPGFVIPLRSANQLEIRKSKTGHRVVGQPDPRARHPVGFQAAVQRRRPPGILDLAESRRQVVARRIAGRQQRLVQCPRAGVRQHRFLRVLGGRVHQAQRIVGAGRSGDGVGGRWTGGADAPPCLRGIADEAVDAAPVAAAVGVENAGVGAQGAV